VELREIVPGGGSVYLLFWLMQMSDLVIDSHRFRNYRSFPIQPG
jgi:hypothetical protein